MPLGGSLPRLEKPRIAQIVEGEPVIREQFQEISRETYKFLSKDFRTSVEAALSSSSGDQIP